MLPLIGIIYSGIIGSVTEVIAYRFNLVQSMTAWTQGSFPRFMIVKVWDNFKRLSG